MAKRKISPDTTAIIFAVEHATETAAQALRDHADLDVRRFDSITASLGLIDTNVKSLLETRSFTKGIWVTASTVAGAISIIATIIVSWWKS